MKKAEPHQKELVVDILSESFDDNKSVNYVVKQDQKRTSRIRGLMEYSFDVCNAFGEVWLSDDEQACALLLLPDKKRTSLAALIWVARLALLVSGISRIGSILSRERKIKEFHPKEPFCYLWFIGVRPELQDRGKGSDLLKQVIEECERKNRPIYLETSVDRNLPWYMQFGFEVFASLQITYTLYLLRRHPRTGQRV